MIKEKYLDFNYYYNSLSTFLKQSYGVKEQFEIFWNALKELDSTGDKIFNNLDITDEDYSTTDKDDILNKLAKLFNVNRDFRVEYNDEIYDLHLSNGELLLLIKAQIIKNNFDGTMEMCKLLYDKAGLPVVMITEENEHATVSVYLNESEANIADNLFHMFMSGLFTIESAGIKYIHVSTDVSKFAVWDSSDTSIGWDNGVWS